MKHVILGAGQVGKALNEVLSVKYETKLRDLEPDDSPDADVLHVCFPYSGDFDLQVLKYLAEYDNPLAIVHSTVPVGTCDRLDIVHSPIRGRHSNLAAGIRTFVKFFGGNRSREAALIFKELGIETFATGAARDTEAGKLWELAQYGINIAVEKAINDYCIQHLLSFGVVYSLFAKTYNEGYTALGEPQFVRPVITHISGPIGGHCVVPGAVLLNHDLTDMIIDAGQDE